MRLVKSLAGLMLFFAASMLHAQVLVVNDDNFGIPFVPDYEPPFLVEPGVLDNDTVDDEPVLENPGTITVELMSDVTYGTLTCDGVSGLCADGSFAYAPKNTLDEPDTPGPMFTGSDSFTYQVTVDSDVSTIATVTLTACTGGKPYFTCWQEASYRAKLSELGYGTIEESFEGTVWDTVRTLPLDTVNSEPEIISRGITWTTNHPDTNEITTGPGPALTGQWGVFDPNHGYVPAELKSFCSTDTTNDPSCLMHDGFSGSIQPGGNSLHGVGGYISGFYGANIAIALDGAPPIGVGKLYEAGHHFLGLIDTSNAGFSNFEFRETDGNVEQEFLIWGDDFIIAKDAVCISCILYLLL